MSKLQEWKKAIAKETGTKAIYVVPTNSFTGWGYAATRPAIKHVISPFNGRYTAFAPITYAQAKK